MSNCKMAYFNCIGLAPGAINNVTSPRSFFYGEADSNPPVPVSVLRQVSWRRIGIRLSIGVALARQGAQWLLLNHEFCYIIGEFGLSWRRIGIRLSIGVALGRHRGEGATGPGCMRFVVAADWNPPFHRCGAGAPPWPVMCSCGVFQYPRDGWDGGIWGNFADFFEYAWWFRGKFVTL